MNRTLKIERNAVKQYLLLFLMFVVHGNRVLSLFNDVILVGILFMGVIFVAFRPSVIRKNNIVFLMTLIGVLAIISIFTAGSLMISTILAMLARFIIAYTVYGIDRQRFVSRFVRLTYCLAIISLVGFILTQLFPQLLMNLLPSYTYYYVSPWSGKRIARVTHYALIYQFRTDNDITRNIGMFNEPGLYQIILNAAFYFLLFYRESCRLSRKKTKRYLLVLFVTLVTTQSATGYVGFIFIVLGYVFAEKKENKWKMLVATITVITALIVYLYFAGTDSWLYKAVLRKLFSEDGTLDLMGSTGKSRIISMIADMQVFLKNPLGNGTKNYESIWGSYLTDIITDRTSPVGFTSSLAIYGIVPVAMIWGKYFIAKWRTKQNMFEWAVCILLIINTALAQPSIFFPCFVLMTHVSHCTNKVYVNDYIGG